MGNTKSRLDIALLEKGLVESREKAKAMIMAGETFVNGQPATKAGIMVNADDEIVVRKKTPEFASRGGLKLQKALELFCISVDGALCMDIGASTGGFTDCLLKHGAKRVWAIDVGYGQLAYKLRTDERVVCLERTNFRHMPFEAVGSKVGFASMDVSFISAAKLAGNLIQFLDSSSKLVVLVKPQFEGKREYVGKNGVVSSLEFHGKILADYLVQMDGLGYSIEGLSHSPIKGPKGNIEFLAYHAIGGQNGLRAMDLAMDAAQKAHGDLNV
ncbi:MAG: TlyA family RNA methyltransferase [Eubacteriaceae bacterium]|nr:TlyA family RNA methyltransferase [Eubacteriaceae bacterium]